MTLLALLMLAPAVAQSGAAGLGVGALAMHVGSGEHPLAPHVAGWGRVALGAVCYAEGEAGLARRAEGGAGADFNELWGRASLGLGCATGTHAVRVAASAGPALTWRHTTIGERWRAQALAPGLRWRGGFLVPLGARAELDLLAGGSSQGLVFDFDLLLQGGVRW